MIKKKKKKKKKNNNKKKKKTFKMYILIYIMARKINISLQELAFSKKLAGRLASAIVCTHGICIKIH